MQIPFLKYHALYNDFLVIGQVPDGLAADELGTLAEAICHRNAGVGADGVLFISASDKADLAVELYNADGTWAEKSGNGLRILGVHLHRSRSDRKEFVIDMGGTLNPVEVLEPVEDGFNVRVSLGKPSFEAAKVPVQAKSKFMISAPIDIEGVELPVTCLAVGNPHTVLFVDSFDLDWRQIGADIERHPLFPNGTNVEFVCVTAENRLEVAEWERGAGETASSGTGAAAAVCAAVMNGLAGRECEVAFEVGSLWVNWRQESDEIILTGPVCFVASGVFEY